MLDWVIGLLGSLLVAGAAYRKRSLSGSGAGAAVVVGTVLYALGNAAWFGTLLSFFITSSLLTKWKQRAKAMAEEHYEKTGRRDAGQVLANGGIAVLLCIGHAYVEHELWFVAFIGVMAAVTADTWATEIGGLSRSRPVSILTGKRVSPGTSGGITLLGLAASLAGGAMIGVAVFLFSGIGASEPYARFTTLLVLGVLSGGVGAWTDSLLGASWQNMNKCQSCGREVEGRHHCDQPTIYVRGVRFLNNDAVNAISSVAGGLCAILLWHALV